MHDPSTGALTPHALRRELELRGSHLARSLVTVDIKPLADVRRQRGDQTADAILRVIVGGGAVHAPRRGPGVPNGNRRADAADARLGPARRCRALPSRADGRQGRPGPPRAARRDHVRAPVRERRGLTAAREPRRVPRPTPGCRFTIRDLPTCRKRRRVAGCQVREKGGGPACNIRMRPLRWLAAEPSLGGPGRLSRSRPSCRGDPAESNQTTVLASPGPVDRVGSTEPESLASRGDAVEGRDLARGPGPPRTPADGTAGRALELPTDGSLPTERRRVERRGRGRRALGRDVRSPGRARGRRPRQRGHPPRMGQPGTPAGVDPSAPARRRGVDRRRVRGRADGVRVRVPRAAGWPPPALPHARGGARMAIARGGLRAEARPASGDAGRRPRRDPLDVRSAARAQRVVQHDEARVRELRVPARFLRRDDRRAERRRPQRSVRGPLAAPLTTVRAGGGRGGPGRAGSRRIGAGPAGRRGRRRAAAVRDGGTSGGPCHRGHSARIFRASIPRRRARRRMAKRGREGLRRVFRRRPGRRRRHARRGLRLRARAAGRGGRT